MNKLIQKLRSILRSLVVAIRLIRKDRKRKFRLKISQQVQCWRNGFLPESWIIYDFDRNSKAEYLDDYTRLRKASTINRTASNLLDSKLEFSYILKRDSRVHHPDIYFTNGHFINFSSGEAIECNQLDNTLKSDKYVLKPSGGGGGTGIEFFDFENQIWSNEKVTYTSEELSNTLLQHGSIFLIYKRLSQTGFASKIYPHSLNTLRILTMIDPDSHEAYIAAAVFRTGVKKSGLVDNWSLGGLSIYLNPEDGTMGKGVTFPSDGTLQWLDAHPDTGIKFCGSTISNWSKINNEILTLAQQFSFLPYIAWDIVPMLNSYKILEANSNTDINLLQVHEPLLKAKKVKKFYKYHNVI